MNNNKLRYNEIVFNDSQIKEIIDLYISGVSSVKIGEKYGVTHKPILKLLKKQNIKIDRTLSTRKYSVDTNYFDIIDTANKAYILGFLYADGSNIIDKCTVSMSLQEEDFEILEKIRKELKSEKPLEYIDYSNKDDFGYKYKNQYRLILFSKHICNSLNNLGMVPNKSLVLRFPNIPENLYPHFIRGYFDGDGSICQQIKNDNNHAVLITITSTENFCMSIKKICESQLNISPGVYESSCKNGITKVLSISGRNYCKKFLEWIYTDAELYMDRKYNRYLEYYNINNSLTA